MSMRFCYVRSWEANPYCDETLHIVVMSAEKVLFWGGFDVRVARYWHAKMLRLRLRVSERYPISISIFAVW